MFRAVLNFATIVLLALIVFGAGATACGIGDDCDDNLGIAAIRMVNHRSSLRDNETRNAPQHDSLTVSSSASLTPVLSNFSHALAPFSDAFSTQPVITPLRS